MYKPLSSIAAIALALLAFTATAADTPASTAFSPAGRVEFSQGGRLTVGNDILAISTPDYGRQIENTDVPMSVELYAMGQRTSWKGRHIEIEKFLEPQGDNSFTVTWALDLKPCGEAAVANLCIEVPPEVFDDLPPQPPRRPDADGVFRLDGLFGGIEASVAGSDGEWFFEDFRKAEWSGRFRFRCRVPYTGLAPWKGRLSMNFKGTKAAHRAFRILDVASAANTGLVDDIDGDREGGWTDQGRNDLSALAGGAELLSRFVPLRVVPRAIVLAGGERTYFPAESGEIQVGFKVRRLDFLHAVAWAEAPGTVAFRYQVRYADGTFAEIPVVTGEDVNNWHGVVEPTRGYVAWEGANSSSSLSLHHSRWVNPSPEKEVSWVKVLGNPDGGAVPMVLGVTALDAEKVTDRQFRALENLFQNKPRNDVDTSAWYPCGLPWGGPGKTIVAGTALDVTAALAASESAFDRHVCGDYGRLVAVGDHLEFERRPGERVAIWGVNLASNASSPPKDLAQGIADNLKRQGVNMVRFHKFGCHPGRQMGKDSLFLPDLQDRMDFFVSVLKNSGIYVYIDWNDELAFPELAGPWPYKKGLIWAPVFMPSFRECERDYALALFGHVNPYTGLSYADDPTVACIEILNEADLCSVINANPRSALDPEFYDELDRQWREWNATRGRPEVNSIADDVGNPDRLRFATDVQREYQQSQRAFLRDELGYRGLVTGNNIVQHAYAATAIDDGMDFAGLHGYVGHVPSYFNSPYDNASAVRTASPGIPFLGQTWARPADKPYCFGEWNFCYPNDYRSEGLPFTTAMMALQGWAMSLFYAFEGPMTWGDWEHFRTWGLEGIFACGAGMDPSTWGLTVPCAIAFRRGDIKPSGNTIAVSHSRDELLEMGNPFLMRQMQFSWMFLFGRVYTEITEEPDETRWPMKREPGLGEWDEIRAVASSLGIEGVTGDCLTSDTGELRKFVGDGLFLLDTPRSKFAVGDLSSMGRDGRVLSGVEVRSPETFAALTLTSLDAEPTPVERAKRVLVCLVGNSRNEAAVIQGRTIIDPGWEKSRTVLAEPLEATLAFQTTPCQTRVFKLSTRTGERQGELAVDADGSFTIPKSAHTIYFEVVRESAPSDLAAAPVDFTQAACDIDCPANLSWTAPAVGSPTGYNVYRRIAPGEKPTLAGMVAAPATNFTDSAAAVGQAYIYTVTAVDAGGESAESEGVTYRRVENVVLGSKEYGSWNSYKDLGGPASKLNDGRLDTGLSGIDGGGALTYVFNAAFRPKLVCARVRPAAWGDNLYQKFHGTVWRGDAAETRKFNGGAVGDPWTFTANAWNVLPVSGAVADDVWDSVAYGGAVWYPAATEIEAYGYIPSLLLGAPSNVDAGIANGVIALSWLAGANASSYKVYRRADGGEWAEVASGLSECACADAAVVRGNAYDYRVSAVSAAGDELSASGISVSIPAGTPLIRPVENVAARMDGTTLTLNWNLANDAATAITVRHRVCGGAWATIAALAGDATTLATDAVEIGCYNEYRFEVGDGIETVWATNDFAVCPLLQAGTRTVIGCTRTSAWDYLPVDSGASFSATFALAGADAASLGLTPGTSSGKTVNLYIRKTLDGAPAVNVQRHWVYGNTIGFYAYDAVAAQPGWAYAIPWSREGNGSTRFKIRKSGKAYQLMTAVADGAWSEAVSYAFVGDDPLDRGPCLAGVHIGDLNLATLPQIAPYALQVSCRPATQLGVR